MPLDGIAIAGVVRELLPLVGGRIDKIYQPEKDEILINVRSSGENHRLLLCANAQAPRVHLSGNVKENPAAAPLFCMVARKQLSGGRILRIEQPDFERVVVFTIESMSEMADLSVKKLIIEIMGKHSNIILTDGNDRILDSVKHISWEQSSVRAVQPGRSYSAPPSQGKANPLLATREELDRKIAEMGGEQAQKFIYRAYSGISPIIASEICLRAGIDAAAPIAGLDGRERDALFKELARSMEEARSGELSPAIYFENGKPKDFLCFPSRVYAGLEKAEFPTVSALLDEFYISRDQVYRMNQKTQDLRKLVQNNIERCVKKRDLQDRTLFEIAGRDKYRVLGELLTANIHSIPGGAEKFAAVNFYEEGCPEIVIPLEPDKSPQENAQKYFKRYAKEKRTFAALESQIAKNDEELKYLEGVLLSVQNCGGEVEIEEIRNELIDGNFAKRRRGKGEKRGKKSKPLKFRSQDGYDIYVGKNNRQNDELTLQFAENTDIWLHTKDIPGSHVIIRANGSAVPNGTIEEAAGLAAFYSKARDSSLVPVDYAVRKHVKKPSGAKPGMVIYENYKTAFVKPEDRRPSCDTY